MNYPFCCPKCGHKENIRMLIQKYNANGHYCPSCNTEMEREISSMVCGMVKDNTGDFYQKVTT